MQRRSQITILLLVPIGLLVKLLQIGVNDLAHDEPFTVLQAHRTIAGLFQILPEENNPPLHFLLMHFWVKLVPLDEGWLRLPSAIFSALIVWPLFRIGERLTGYHIALIASLLSFFSNYHVGFAHEVRAYSLFALLATTSIWQLIRVSEGRSIFWLAVVNVLLIYTHFFGWLMIGIQLLCVLLLKEWRKDQRSMIKVIAIALLSYLPYFYIFLLRLNTSVGEGTWLDPPSIEEPYNMIWRWSNAPIMAATLIILIAIHSIRSRMRDLLTRMAVIWTFVPLIGMFLVSFMVPMYLDRYLIYASPGFYLLSAVSLHSLVPFPKWKLVPSALVVLLMVFTFQLRNTSWPKPSEVVRTAEELKQGNNAIVLIHPWWYAHTYAWHLDRELFRDPDRLIEKLDERSIIPIHEIPSITIGPEQNLVIAVIAGAEEGRQFTEFLAREQITTRTIEPDRNVRVDLLTR